jgi:ATP-dependent protease ClpP protease subunit
MSRMPISTTLNCKVPVIRLAGEIDMAAAYGLLDEIRLLHDYYQFRTIVLEIDSPGGSADALHHLVQLLKPWRNGEGRTLRTVGLNEIASAAALLLSFGTVGHRTVSGHSRLLYHASRRPERDGLSHTAAQLRVATRLLERWDKTFVDLLVEHIASVGVEKTAYRKKLMRLFRQERFITPQEALNLFLIDRVEP